MCRSCSNSIDLIKAWHCASIRPIYPLRIGFTRLENSLVDFEADPLYRSFLLCRIFTPFSKKYFAMAGKWEGRDNKLTDFFCGNPDKMN